MWIDSHCHLNHAKFEGADPADLIAKAGAAHVSGLLTICCRVHEELKTLTQLCDHHQNLWCSVGTHPHDASHPDEQSISLEDLILRARSHSKIIGIGESGLDYYYNFSAREDQEHSFRKHIRACIATNLPLIVHARDADEDIERILKEEGQGTNLKGVMHCFSSGPKLAQAALEMGFYISFSGIITFKNATPLQDIAKSTPQDRILVETDAPFLAPVPHRGKLNQPAFVHHTGEFLANLRGMSAQEFAKLTSANFFRLFDKAALP
jgi:TatD DNase family protein